MGSPAIWLGGLVAFFLFLLSVEKDLRLAGSAMGEILRQNIATELCDYLYQSFTPSFAFVQEQRVESTWFVDGQVAELMPLYGYSLEQKKEEQAENEFLSLDEILLAEAQEGSTTAGELPVDGNGQSGDTGNATGGTAQEGASLEELLQAENEAAIQAREAENEAAREFVPHDMQVQVNPEELKDYETLVSRFYTIDGNTMAGSDQLDAAKLLSADMTISKEGEEPQILIYHTHSQEAFADSVPGDKSTSIVGVGDRLCQILTEKYGYKVLHHTGEYDVESRDDAYSASLPAIEQVLAENPSIEVVIDLHRDSMAEETRLVMDLDGRPTARFMFFNGLSRTRKTGDISYLYNENLDANLAFSFQMKLKAEEYYPGLTRKNYLKGYRYNMHLRPRTLLIELGAQNNTVEEAMNACEPLAHILDMVLTGQ